MSIARRLSAAALAALMTLGLTACSGGEESSTAAKSGLEDGVLTVAMECAYAPSTGPRPMNAMAVCRSRIPITLPTALM